MKKQTIKKLRESLKLPENISDEEISKKLKGTFSEVIVNINIATSDLKRAFSQAIPNVFKKHFK